MPHRVLEFPWMSEMPQLTLPVIPLTHGRPQVLAWPLRSGLGTLMKTYNFAIANMTTLYYNRNKSLKHASGK